MGLGYVAPERNPMRPEVFTRVLQRIATSTLEGSATAVLSVKALTKPLGRELVQIYISSINTLKQSSVTAASYQFRIQPSAPAPQKSQIPASDQAQAGQAWTGSAGGSGGTGGRGDGAPSTVNLSDYKVKTGLLRDFLAGQSTGGEQSLSATYYDDIEQELADLKAAPNSAPAAFAPSSRETETFPFIE